MCDAERRDRLGLPQGNGAVSAHQNGEAAAAQPPTHYSCGNPAGNCLPFMLNLTKFFF